MHRAPHVQSALATDPIRSAYGATAPVQRVAPAPSRVLVARERPSDASLAVVGSAPAAVRSAGLSDDSTILLTPGARTHTVVRFTDSPPDALRRAGAVPGWEGAGYCPGHGRLGARHSPASQNLQNEQTVIGPKYSATLSQTPGWSIPGRPSAIDPRRPAEQVKGRVGGRRRVPHGKPTGTGFHPPPYQPDVGFSPVRLEARAYQRSRSPPRARRRTPRPALVSPCSWQVGLPPSPPPQDVTMRRAAMPALRPGA